jgi:Ca2+-binding EF-hand superfamily protein
MAFRIFDLDKNNLIDKKEMRRVVESLYDLNGIPSSQRKGANSVNARVEQIMKQIDQNGKLK